VVVQVHLQQIFHQIRIGTHPVVVQLQTLEVAVVEVAVFSLNLMVRQEYYRVELEVGAVFHLHLQPQELLDRIQCLMVVEVVEVVEVLPVLPVVPVAMDVKDMS